MGRRAKDQMKCTLQEKTLALLNDVSSELIKRGVKEVDMGELVETLICERKQSTVDKFVSERTPLEWKLKAILNDPNASEQIAKITEKRNFGMTINAPV